MQLFCSPVLSAPIKGNRFLLLSATLFAMPALAYQPLVTDDTGTQGESGNQVEVSYAHARETSSGVAGKTVTREIPLVFTRGLTDSLDIYVGAISQRISTDGAVTNVSDSGIGNVAIGAKWRFFENKDSGLSFGFKPEVQLPVSEGKEARGLGTGRLSYGATLIVTQETGFGELHFNLALGRVNYADQAINDAARRDQYRVSVAPVWHVAEKFKIALDLGAMTNEDRTQKERMGYVELGAIYSPSEDLDLAVGVIRNTNTGDVSSTQALLGLTWRFK